MCKVIPMATILHHTAPNVTSRHLLDRERPDENDFFHPDYVVGCGGTEVPCCYQGRWYLYVVSRDFTERAWYGYTEDQFFPEGTMGWEGA